MMSILKTFGIGLLYTILSPFILLVLVLYFAYTFIIFIAMFVVNVVYFFQGRSIKDELEIDKEAKKILQAQAAIEQQFKESILNQYSAVDSSFNQNNFSSNAFNQNVNLNNYQNDQNSNHDDSNNLDENISPVDQNKGGDYYD